MRCCGRHQYSLRFFPYVSLSFVGVVAFFGPRMTALTEMVSESHEASERSGTCSLERESGK